MGRLQAPRLSAASPADLACEAHAAAGSLSRPARRPPPSAACSAERALLLRAASTFSLSPPTHAGQVLHVRNLPPDATEADVLELCRPFGRILRIKLTGSAHNYQVGCLVRQRRHAPGQITQESGCRQIARQWDPPTQCRTPNPSSLHKPPQAFVEYDNMRPAIAMISYYVGNADPPRVRAAEVRRTLKGTRPHVSALFVEQLQPMH
jgi:hypothetical protein